MKELGLPLQDISASLWEILGHHMQVYDLTRAAFAEGNMASRSLANSVSSSKQLGLASRPSLEEFDPYNGHGLPHVRPLQTRPSRKPLRTIWISSPPAIKSHLQSHLPAHISDSSVILFLGETNRICKLSFGSKKLEENWWRNSPEMLFTQSLLNPRWFPTLSLCLCSTNLCLQDAHWLSLIISGWPVNHQDLIMIDC